MVMTDEYRYWVPVWAVPLLENGDDSHLDDDERDAVTRWLGELNERHGRCDVVIADPSDDPNLGPMDFAEWREGHEFAEFGADECVEAVLWVRKGGAQ